MAWSPPPYPRVPHLWRPSVSTDDLVVAAAERAGWFSEPVTVEEKLDGANVCLWFADDQLQVASRGGPGARDRAGQLGRLRAWGSQHDTQLRQALDGGWSMYAEWLWLAHGITYDRLPALLVVLDLWRTDVGFARTADRDERAESASLAVPPRLFCGVLSGPTRLRGLVERSRYSSNRMEGVILRRGPGQLCKVVRDDYRRRSDDQWSVGRAYNQLATATDDGSRSL